jgi:hypothetical protein
MKSKKHLLIIIIAVIFVFIWIFVRFVFTQEDSWIKDENGVYVKHGNPSQTPDYVAEQHEAINCALEKFQNFSEEKNSQCLGVCGSDVKFAVDIVHVPRIEEDNQIENRCEAYRNKSVSHFIELDKNGNIVRVV